MNNTSKSNSHFQVLGSDGVNAITVYKVPASSIDQEGEFIISISENGTTNTVTIPDASAIEFISLFTGLIYTSETDRLKTINEGQELKPLSVPLQNLLRHIHKSASDKINGNK